jgi:hypothetical protein
MSNLVYPHLGHYKVGNQVFNEKLEAIVHANQTKADVEWYFHDDKYAAVDWTVEPELSLDQFYKMRAQQIREQYDYVVVMCSGGGDSTNVVYSFLRNGIHIDEVIASAPLGGLDRWNNTVKDNSPDNTMSETKLVQLPLISDIKQEFPHVKVTINDYFDHMVNFKTDDWLFRCGEWIHPTSGARYNLENLTHLRDLAEAGKKIGIVFGIDKPMLAFSKGDVIKIILSDKAVSVQRPAFDKPYPNVHNVLFYFTPDLPWMQVKQAHVVAKWIFQPENAHVLPFVKDARTSSITYETQRHHNSTYQRLIIPCIYPSTYRPVFQGHKPTRMFLGEHDAWFYELHGNTNMYEMIDSDFRNFYKSIDEKYYNGNKTGFKMYFKHFTIGSIDSFKSKSLSLIL